MVGDIDGELGRVGWVARVCMCGLARAREHARVLCVH